MKIQTGKKAKPRKLLIYGVPGVGKSTFAAGSSRPIFIQTEDGLDDIGPARVRIDKAGDINEALRTIKTVAADYDTLILDGCSGMNDMLVKKVCDVNGKESLVDVGGYGKGYAYLLDEWKAMLDLLMLFTSEFNMGLILVAHSQIRRFEDPMQEGYDRYLPALRDNINEHLINHMDEVFFAEFKTHVRKTEGGVKGPQSKAIGGTERILHTTNLAAARAKNRLGMPPEIKLDWKEYAAHWPTKTQATTTTKKASK